MTYDIIFEVNYSALHPAIKELEDELNKSMSGFGFDEKAIIRTELPLILTCDRPMTKVEISRATDIILITLNDKGMNAILKSFILTNP